MKLIIILLFPLFCFGQNNYIGIGNQTFLYGNDSLRTMEARNDKAFFINLPYSNSDSLYIKSSGDAPLIGIVPNKNKITPIRNDRNRNTYYYNY